LVVAYQTAIDLDRHALDVLCISEFAQLAFQNHPADLAGALALKADQD